MNIDILIIQPSWDHSEVIGGLFSYLINLKHKNVIKNLKIKILSDYSHHDGDYYNYFINIFDMRKYVELSVYQSPKFHINDIINANYIFFLDSIHLNKFYQKLFFRESKIIQKIITFNHFEKKIISDNIFSIHLGEVPYNYNENPEKFNDIDKKFMITNYFNYKNEFHQNIKHKFSKTLNFLIVGTPEHRNINFLKSLLKLENEHFLITYIVRKRFDIIENVFLEEDSNNSDDELDFLNDERLVFLHNVTTERLIKEIQNCDIVMTLFKSNSVYHRDRISGIIPFAISFGKPILTDDYYVKQNEFDFICDEFIYENTEDTFIKTFEKLILLFKLNILEFISLYYYQTGKIEYYRDTFITQQDIMFDDILKIS